MDYAKRNINMQEVVNYKSPHYLESDFAEIAELSAKEIN